MAKVVLYSFAASSCSFRVRVALKMKEIEYEYRSVIDKSIHTDEFRKINPKCEVPVLLIDGLVLTQSLPIIEYLDETRPGIGYSFLPKEPSQRVLVRRLAEIINSGIQPIQNRSVLQHLPEEVNRIDWSSYWIARGFRALERELEKSAGKFCVGDTITMADLCLVPQVYNAYKFDVDMTEFPLIRRIFTELDSMEVFQMSAPKNQPDYQ